MFIVSAILGLAKEGLSFLNKKQDVDLEKYKVDGVVKTELIQADTDMFRARTARIVAQFTYFGFRLCTYLVIFPTAVWFAVGMYDSTFRNLLPDYMTWRTLELPTDMKVTAGLVFTYLLAEKWINK